MKRWYAPLYYWSHCSPPGPKGHQGVYQGHILARLKWMRGDGYRPEDNKSDHHLGVVTRPVSNRSNQRLAQKATMTWSWIMSSCGSRVTNENIIQYFNGSTLRLFLICLSMSWKDCTYVIRIAMEEADRAPRPWQRTRSRESEEKAKDMGFQAAYWLVSYHDLEDVCSLTAISIWYMKLYDI